MTGKWNFGVGHEDVDCVLIACSLILMENNCLGKVEFSSNELFLLLSEALVGGDFDDSEGVAGIAGLGEYVECYV